MRVKNPTKRDFFRYYFCYTKYIREMRSYDRTLGANIFTFIKMFRTRNVYQLILRDGMSVRGFITIFVNGDSFCVLDAYIDPAYRGRGIGSAIVEHIRTLHDGSACMYIFKHDVRARKFWANCFADCYMRKAKSLIDGYDFYVFEKGDNWWDK